MNQYGFSYSFKRLTLESSMNILFVKKKIMRMRLESQSIFGNMESGQPALLPVEEGCVARLPTACGREVE